MKNTSAKQSHYKILGVPENATEREIKTAYLKAARQHHPDKGGDPEKFKLINEANEILSSPEKRRLYDKDPNYEFKYGDYYDKGPTNKDTKKEPQKPSLWSFSQEKPKQANTWKELLGEDFYIKFYRDRYSSYKNNSEKLKELLSNYKNKDLTEKRDLFLELQRLFHFAFDDDKKRADFIKYYIDEIVPKDKKEITIKALQNYIIVLATPNARKEILKKLFTDEEKKQLYYVNNRFVGLSNYLAIRDSFCRIVDIGGSRYLNYCSQYLEEIKDFSPKIIFDILKQENYQKRNALYGFLYEKSTELKTLQLLENLEHKDLIELLNHKNHSRESALTMAKYSDPNLHQKLISTLHKVASKTTENIINKKLKTTTQVSEEEKSMKEIRKDLLEVKNSIASELLDHRVKQIKSLFTGEKTTLTNKDVKELKDIKNNIGKTIRKNYTIADRFVDGKKPNRNSSR